MKINYGPFSDVYRGHGHFVSFGFKDGWLLFAFRPRNWHLHFSKLLWKPAVRAYVGPFEVEFFRVKS